MAAETVCEADSITHKYRDSFALSHVSFGIDAGRVTGLVGANGSGKSTLLRILAGVQKPTAGRVMQFGYDISVSESAGHGVGAAVDGMNLWPGWTVQQTLRYIADVSGAPRSRITSAMHDAQIDHAARSKLRTLSLGNRQRVSLAVALVAGTRLVLLDEPMNGLDPDARQHTRDLIVRLASEGRAVLLSSHDLNDVEALASNLVVLRLGEVAYDGPTSDFRAATSMAVLEVTGDVADAQAVLVQSGLHCRRGTTGELVIFAHDAEAALALFGQTTPARIISERPATLEERFHGAR